MVKNGVRIRQDITGQRFGKLTVTGVSRVRDSQNTILWNCLCDCGNKTRVKSATLKNGNTRSCGCLRVNNLKGADNPSAKRSIAKCGFYVPTTDEWYERAVGVVDRAKKENVRFGFKTVSHFVKYLHEIAPKKCPVFGIKLVTSKGGPTDWSPSIDRIVPSKGYVPGNIQVISMLANKMKQNATPKQLDRFADWVLEAA